jgi:hypothetical protein
LTRTVAALLLAAAATVETPPFRVVALPGGERIEISPGGQVLDLATPRDAGGRRTVVLLVDPIPADPGRIEGTCGVRDADERPGDGPALKLMEFWRDADPPVRTLRDDLPRSTSRVGAFDLDGDGRDELLLGRRGTLEAWDPRAGSRPIASFPGGWFRSDHGTPGGPVAPSRLHVFEAGGVTSFGPRDGVGFAALGSMPLPVLVRAGSRSAWVHTRPYVPVGRSASGGDLLAADPEPVGDDRLRVWLAEPETTGAEAVACWARLPGPERTVDSDFIVLDGKPALVATTMRADKMEFFGEKRLRVFRLEPDRTRTGIAPFLAAETGANLWQPVQARVADVDGDGRDDLVLAYWKGLKDEKVEFEIWSRDAEGRWPPKPVSGSVDVPEGDRSFLSFGSDLDGDGLSDLLVSGKGSLRIHRGVARARRGLPVESAPSAVLALPEGVASLGSSWVGVGADGVQGGSDLALFFAPRPVDLDGDGIAELVLLDAKRRDRLSVYRWTARKSR